MSLFSKEIPAANPGLGSAAAWHITVKLFRPTDNIAHREVLPRFSNVRGKWFVQSHRVTNLEWFEANKPTLAAFAGRWVAIHEEAVVANGNTFQDVYTQLQTAAINGALITKVPGNVHERTYLIA